MFLLSGVARYLFVPLAEAVVFAMIASYFFSRTLIPTLAMYLLRASPKDGEPARGPVRVPDRASRRLSSSASNSCATAITACCNARSKIAAAFCQSSCSCCVGSLALVPFTGRDFFPAVDTGEIRLHLRAPTGTRIEETARLTDEVEAKIRTVIPQAGSRPRCSTTSACR